MVPKSTFFKEKLHFRSALTGILEGWVGSSKRWPCARVEWTFKQQ